MDNDPEILFHRYFQEQSATEQAKYRGKYDLSKPILTPFENILALLQVAINDSLRQEDLSVEHHVEHLPVHFDYIDSDREHARAFSFGEYSFIGVTDAILRKIWRGCAQIDPLASESLRNAVRNPIGPDRIGTVLFRLSVYFVVSHEYTHIVHGHVSESELRTLAFSESLPMAKVERLESQAQEVDADGYGAFHVIANLIRGDERDIAISILGLEQESKELQDNALFSCFVMAVGGIFYNSAPVTVNASSVYEADHPAQAARMHLVTSEAHRWCGYNEPAIQRWITPANFNFLMAIVAQGLWGPEGMKNWADQTAFFRSQAGGEYLQRLQDCWSAQRDAMASREQVRS